VEVLAKGITIQQAVEMVVLEVGPQASVILEQQLPVFKVEMVVLGQELMSVVAAVVHLLLVLRELRERQEVVVLGRKVVSRPYRPFIVVVAVEELSLVLLEPVGLVVEVMGTTQETEPLVLQTVVVVAAVVEVAQIRMAALADLALSYCDGMQRKLSSRSHLA
jgi:hypothetical protein